MGTAFVEPAFALHLGVFPVYCTPLTSLARDGAHLKIPRRAKHDIPFLHHFLLLWKILRHALPTVLFNRSSPGPGPPFRSHHGMICRKVDAFAMFRDRFLKPCVTRATRRRRPHGQPVHHGASGGGASLPSRIRSSSSGRSFMDRQRLQSWRSGASLCRSQSSPARPST